jgi:predicted kinase
MKYLKVFKSYIVNEEVSKNDPIQELNFNEKIGIVLLGTSGVGKSTFAENFIKHRRRDIKIFSTDDVSLTRTKNPNLYKKGSSELNLKKLESYINVGKGSFIYDTTGVQKVNISSVTKHAHNNGYQVIFIHLIGSLDMSLRQNIQRDRNVPEDFIKHAYDEQFKNMKYFSELNPESYYIIYNIDGKYKFMKYENGKILKRKVDKYVLLKESIENKKNEFDIEDIMLYVIDVIDAGYKVSFNSINGMTLIPEDIYQKTQTFTYFKLTDKVYDKIRSKFSIRIAGKGNSGIDFTKFEEVINIMAVSTQHLKLKSWILSDFKINTIEPGRDNPNGDISFSSIEFIYTKPDVQVKEEVALNQIKKEKIIRAFENEGIYIEKNSIVYYDDYIQIQEYDTFSREDSITSRINDVCNQLGASDWEWHNGKNMINIFF